MNEQLIDLSLVPANEPYIVSMLEEADIPACFGVSDAKLAFSGTLTRYDGRFILDGVMAADVTAPCALCLKDAVTKLEVSVHEVFARTVTDVDDWLVTGNTIDINPALSHNLIAKLPGKIVCGEDCKGLCHVCGTDLNLSGCDCGKNERMK